MMDLPRLLLIADEPRERPGALEAAVTAGAPFVQIRDKNMDDETVLVRFESVKAPWICINSRPSMARKLGIGLHLPAAHEAVPREGIPLIGRSAHDEEEVRRAVAEGVDYLIVGTVFPSASKPGRAALGLDGLARLTALAAPLPVFAIGGITPERVAPVLATSAHGVAVCSAVLDVADPAAATQHFLSELNP